MVTPAAFMLTALKEFPLSLDPGIGFELRIGFGTLNPFFDKGLSEFINNHGWHPGSLQFRLDANQV